MIRHTARAMLLLLLVAFGPIQPSMGQDEPPPAETQADTSEPTEPAEPPDPLEILLDEIDDLQADIRALRRTLAQAKLEAASARREIEELRNFIRDHEELGRDFGQYRAIKRTAEQEARRRQAEASRTRRQMERGQQTERAKAARAGRAVEEAEARRQARYRQAGFTAVGFDIYVGQMAYYYQSHDRVPYRFDYVLGFGRYLRFYPPYEEIDFSSMIISGTVLNANEEVRNIGVAVTFFDEAGNQVGGEIVQINNARPDVPYPFTATLDMALDRPFSSSTTYVLYADPATTEQEPAPTTKPQP